MEAHVEISESCKLQLRHALLVYTDEHAAFATLHDVLPQTEGAPLLAPAQPLSLAFLRRLAEGLGSRVAPEVLPPTVLARTPEMLAWWVRASCRIMFFGATDNKARQLNGHVFPQPSLVFKVCRGDLFVRALERDARPEANARLKTAPYWNVAGDSGRVCLGTVRAPECISVESIAAWETSFFQSEFTHLLGAARLTSHPGGFVALWSSLAGKKKFPVRYLTDARQTLREFIGQER